MDDYPYGDCTDTKPSVVVTSLTARANAVKMLHTRIQLLKSYLTGLPPSYFSHEPVGNGTTTDDAPAPATPEINHSILRSIQALVNRLPLVVPADGAAFEQESLAEKSDVALVALLGDLTRGTKDLRDMGKKFSIVNHGKQRQRPGKALSQMTENAEDQYYQQMMYNEQPYD